MTKDEALKLALEAFEEIAWSNSTDWQRDRAKVVIPAIKEALAQPQRTWVGLDADEVFELASGRWTLGQMAVLVEAKLKEKNNG